MFDPNVRVRRWRSEREAIDLVHEVLEGAALLKVNRTEAELLTGTADPAAAAAQLVAAGARLVAVTLGSEGAHPAGRGERRRSRPRGARRRHDRRG